MKPIPSRHAGARPAPRALWLIALLALGMAGCENGTPPRFERAGFDRQGIRIFLSRAAPLDEITLRRPGGAVLMRRGLAGVFRKEIRVGFPWQPGERFDWTLKTGGDGNLRGTLRAPAEPPLPYALSLQIPHGLRSTRVSLPAGVRLHATVEIQAGAQAAGSAELRLALPSAILPGKLPPGWKRTRAGGTLWLTKNISLESHAVWFEQIPLRFPRKEKQPLAVSATLVPERKDIKPLQVRTVLRLRPPGALSRAIRLEESWFPTDAGGIFDPQHLRDALVLPGGPGEFLRKLWGTTAPPVNPYVPYRHQTLWLRNTSSAAIPVAVSSAFISSGSRESVPFLRAPDLLSGGTGRSVAFADLAPGKTTAVTLPVYFDPRSAAPGRYLRDIRVTLRGTDQELSRALIPFRVQPPSHRAFFITLATLALALFGFFFVIRKGRALLRAFPLRLLSGAAIFAAAAFVLANIPEIIAGNIALGLLGPFGFLVSAFFIEVPANALGVAYLMRYPVPGALGLFIVIRKILAALLLYSFQAIPFLLLTAEILAFEGAAWASGVTRGGAAFFDPPAARRTRSTLLFIGLFALANILITAISFYLHIFFYRLNFADWYIALYLITLGTIFAPLGIFFGIRLGAPLREVAG